MGWQSTMALALAADLAAELHKIPTKVYAQIIGGPPSALLVCAS